VARAPNESAALLFTTPHCTIRVSVFSHPARPFLVHHPPFPTRGVSHGKRRASDSKSSVPDFTHLSKSGGTTKAVYRAMGSLAFAAAARAVWAITKDPADAERRLFLPAKLNLAREPDGLAYRIVDDRVVWEYEPVKMHADEAFEAEAASAAGKTNRGAERREAAAWLREQLAGGPKPASEVIELGEQDGFTKRTLQRALKEVGGERTKDAFNGPWLWSLPGEGDEGANEDANSPRGI
jgi:hypothetical protein